MRDYEGLVLTTSRVDILFELLGLCALVGILPRLQLQNWAGLAEAVGAESVHGTLESAVFPSEEVIAVLSVSGPIQSQYRVCSM